MQKTDGIRIPGVILDELKTLDYSQDERFSISEGKKRRRGNGKHLSRKEKRKMERADKKRKIISTREINSSRLKSAPTSEKRSANAGVKNVGKQANGKNPISSDESESNENWVSDEVLTDEVAEESGEQAMSAEETMKKLESLKRKAKGIQGAENSGEIKGNSYEKKHIRNRDTNENFVSYPLAPSDRSAFERDEMDMQYYAKKLGLKGERKAIHAKDEFDAIGGLLEGLEYFENYGKSDEEYGDFATETNSMRKDDEASEKAFSSDDDLSASDFEDSDGLSESDNDSVADSDDNYRREKENPYVAPTQSVESYVPPSLRKKLDDSENNSTLSEISKKVNSSLNKLSDSNITIIITDLNRLYDSLPRQYVTESLTKGILNIISQNQKLLDGFIMNYAALAYTLSKLRGIEVGAFFIQKTVEAFLHHYEEEMENILKDQQSKISSKICINIATLLSYCYNFGFVSCRLIYDIIRIFVADPNEFTTELLLRIISISGQLIRGDDPSALRDIRSELLKNAKNLKEQSPRLRFLMDTMSDLKNNRLKPSILATDHHPLKKNLQSILNSSSSWEPLQVSLEDIKNIDSKGKWWLVGASWRGNMENAFEVSINNENDASKSKKSKISIEDDLLDDIPDWNIIARQQRMNTDIRRAIFISIMSAQDYLDAFSKLEKLSLKNKQVLEIPRIVLHCLLADSGSNGYNHYYALVANKICERYSHLSKSFQFLFWDVIKKFEDKEFDSESDTDEEDDLDDKEKLLRISNQGRFFGSLLANDILKLDVFKHVPFMGGLNTEGMLFMEILLFQLFLTVAKKSEKKLKMDESGNKRIIYSDDYLRDVLTKNVKSENMLFILKGLKWFINKKFRYHNFLAGKKGDKAFDRDERRLAWASKAAKSIIDKELENIDS
ncbi:Sgd1p [Saccharomyces cerevisiae YJM1208]|nr:Sgd1p [Saccharomyces cerevisiae YJM1208]AJV71889.1 Sgd1p [Saccharomyces cerevisiae YJM1615]